MKFKPSRPHARARLGASLLMASAVSLLSVASANAQTVKPTTEPTRTVVGIQAGVPTTLAVIPGLPTAPGGSPTTGVTLEQSQAAFQALSASAASPASQKAPATVTGGITAVFMAPVGVLSVIGTAQDDTIVVSRVRPAACWSMAAR